MATVTKRSLRRIGSRSRSRSEGTLIDLDDDGDMRCACGPPQVPDQACQPECQQTALQASNPFWREVSHSNPFLDDMISMEKECRRRMPPSTRTLEGDPLAEQDEDDEDGFSTSSDETSLGLLRRCRRVSTKRSGVWNSASDILGILHRKEQWKEKKKVSTSHSWNQFVGQDAEWIKGDLEAYKVAWLNHRQLRRSCLELGTMRQGPGWARSQAADAQIVCRFSHSGGSMYLPEADISAHVPEGHVGPGDIQEIALTAIFDPPQGLNHDLSTTVTPLLEVSLSNIAARGGISLEMKVAGEVKGDPVSQVMAEFVCLIGTQREGPFHKTRSFYLYKNTLQVKLLELKPRLYLIAAIQATAVQPPATSVWDFTDRSLTVAIYGPKHIHPSFKVFCVVFCHSQVPPKLPFYEVKQSNGSIPPLVLQLWGKHHFTPKGLKDFQISAGLVNSKFEVKPVDQAKTVQERHMKAGRIVRFPFVLTKSGGGEMLPFKLRVLVKDAAGLPLAEFHVSSPKAAPRKLEKCGESTWPPVILEEVAPQPCTFRNKPVAVPQYGVALKSVVRQSQVEYLLDFFKGDTMAILCQETLRAMGQFKVKEWYIGFLRGRLGLVHCKNVKLITHEQVIDISGAVLSTQVLLDNIALPFQKLTYMYSAVQSLVTEGTPCWSALGSALGYSGRTLDELVRARRVESEAERITCVLEKLKEDCHQESSKKKFLHELCVGLLKIGCLGLVVRLARNAVILSAAVQLGARWRELAERLTKLSAAQITAFEEPHRSQRGELSPQAMWKPAYDFLYAWSQCHGDRHREAIQDLQAALDRMRRPITRQWRQVSGVLLGASCVSLLRTTTADL